MSLSDDPPLDPNTDQVFRHQIERLHLLMVWSRWLVVLLLWVTVGALSLWNLRSDIELWLDYFTWTAVRYALAYNPAQAIGLSLCIGMTAAVLIWQSRNILWGIPRQEQERLEKQVYRIRQQGQSHPLWNWVCQPAPDKLFH